MINFEVEIDTPEDLYCRKDTKHNVRQRKKLNILQYGNSLVSFKFERSKGLVERFHQWWELSYYLEGESFNCELYMDNGYIEVLFFEETPFYKGKSGNESVTDKPTLYVEKYLELIPEDLHKDIISCKISDWDYSNYPMIEDYENL